MDETFIKSIQTNTEIKQCQGCHISYEDAKGFSQGKVFQFLFTHGVLAKEVTCKICSNKVKLCANQLILNCDHSDFNFTCFPSSYRCHRKVSLQKKKARPCGFTQSLLTGTFCHNLKLKVKDLFQLTCAVLSIPPPRKKYLCTSSGSNADWYLRLREVLIVAVSENSEKLGGEGHHVEIYEAVNGELDHLDEPWSWAVGGIDLSSGNTFLIPVEQLNSITVKNIILEKVHPCTTIVSDCLKKHGLNEFKNSFTNHKIKFLVTSKCYLANKIRRCWCEVIRGDPSISYKRKRVNINHLAEYFFKSKYSNPTSRLHAFFEAAGKLYPQV